MVYLRSLSIILGLWGSVELLLGITSVFTYEVGTSNSLKIGLVCLLIASIMHIFYKIMREKKDRYGE